MKYIITQDTETNYYYYPCVFSDEISHRDIARAMCMICSCKVVSAGYLRVENGDYRIDSMKESKSLNIGPRPQDTQILTLFLKFGLTGQELTNALVFWTDNKKLNSDRTSFTGKFVKHNLV